MRLCQNCGSGIPNYAGFCGTCGQLVSINEPTTRDRTVWISHPTHSDDEQQTLITDNASQQTGLKIEDENTNESPAITSEDEEEEKRRRRLLADFSLPLLTGPPTPNAPMVQGTPQIGGAPTVQGTFPITGGLLSAGEGGPGYPLVLPHPQNALPQPAIANPSPYFPPGPAGPPHLAPKPKPPQPAGCIVWLSVIIIVPLLILGGILGIGLTIFAPTLAFDGSTSVSAGQTVHLSGNHFIPGNSVTLLLDGSIPLSYSSNVYPIREPNALTGTLLLANQGMATDKTAQTKRTTVNTTTHVGSSGTFTVIFVVGSDWKPGQHTIRASEQFSPRSATATFTITGNTQPTSTSTSVPTATITPTPTVTPSTTVTPQTTPGLSAITPNVVTFGPLSEGYTQPTSTSVLLSTTGTALLNWTATWNAAQAPWLHLNTQSGQIQGPGTQTLVISATIGNLKAGTYTTTITFESTPNLTLSVSLTVQAGCIKATPTMLNFNATLGANDPPAQTLAINNCGALGSWSEATTGGTWLLASPTGGNLNNGATQNIIVSAKLATITGAGPYQGQIILTNGAAHVTVNVLFTVQTPLPQLGVNTTTISINQQCTFQRIWKCSVTLNSSPNAQSNLNWTAAPTGTVAITVNPTHGILQPGQTAVVALSTPRVACTNGTTLGTVIFTGPANSITVTVTC